MWEQTFNSYLDTLLQKPSNQLFTTEKTEKIVNVLKNGKVETARFRQYVKEKKFTLINCPEFGMDEELCIPASEVRILYFYIFKFIIEIIAIFKQSLPIR